MIRSFFAIDLPAALKAEIRRLQSRLRRTGADVKWARPEGVHLTLKFLGDTPDGLVPELARSAARAVAPHGPLTLGLGGLGVFPHPARPRVVWVGLAGQLDRLSALRRDLESAVAGHGYPPEKRDFTPHLTLGRVRSGQGHGELMAELDRLVPEPADFTVRDVILFKSDLKPTGAVYTVLERFPLSDGPGADNREEGHE